MNEQTFLEKARDQFGHFAKRKDLLALGESTGHGVPSFLLRDKTRRAARGEYDLRPDYTEEPKVKKTRGRNPKQAKPQVSETVIENLKAVDSEPAPGLSLKSDLTPGQLIPDKDPLFVRHGNCADVERIVASKIFYPTFITGLLGNGKTVMVEQAAAKAGRDLVRVNVTIETDEDDLFGGFRLVNGETKWFDGPVIQAMKLGAVLLLDEVDLASTRIMCLQPVLEGKGVLLKKINQFVAPAPGFNIIATANTKGQGNESGKFVGTGIMNEAFLERFAITMEQEYATETKEKKIILKLLESHGLNDHEKYATRLCRFGYVVREGYKNQSIDDIISTRRLVHMVNAYAIFQDEQKAFDLCTSRFEESARIAMKEMWQSLQDPDEAPIQEEPKVEEEDLHALFDASEDLDF